MEINDAFKGRVAVVTGASSGIGREVAGQLAAAGMKVGALARREERLQALASERDGVLPVSCDVRDERSVKDAFARVGTELGPCAVVVNNAGLGRKRSLLDGDTDAWREMLEVNVLGLAVCTREALAQMLPEAERGRWGYVIHISSMAGHRVPRGSGMYAATKHAVRALTEALRQELVERAVPIRVSEISPGLVETEFAAVYAERDGAAEEAYGRFKVLEPVDVGHAVLNLLAQPQHVAIHDVLMRPSAQPS